MRLGPRLFALAQARGQVLSVADQEQISRIIPVVEVWGCPPHVQTSERQGMQQTAT
jgi:hypothetical protein